MYSIQHKREERVEHPTHDWKAVHRGTVHVGERLDPLRDPMGQSNLKVAIP